MPLDSIVGQGDLSSLSGPSTSDAGVRKVPGGLQAQRQRFDSLISHISQPNAHSAGRMNTPNDAQRIYVPSVLAIDRDRQLHLQALHTNRNKCDPFTVLKILPAASLPSGHFLSSNPLKLLKLLKRTALLPRNKTKSAERTRWWCRAQPR